LQQFRLPELRDILLHKPEICRIIANNAQVIGFSEGGITILVGDTRFVRRGYNPSGELKQRGNFFTPNACNPLKNLDSKK
jgi:hypothetical protein